MFAQRIDFGNAFITFLFMLKISEETLEPNHCQNQDEPIYYHNVNTEPDGNPLFHDIKNVPSGW